MAAPAGLWVSGCFTLGCGPALRGRSERPIDYGECGMNTADKICNSGSP